MCENLIFSYEACIRLSVLIIFYKNLKETLRIFCKHFKFSGAQGLPFLRSPNQMASEIWIISLCRCADPWKWEVENLWKINTNFAGVGGFAPGTPWSERWSLSILFLTKSAQKPLWNFWKVIEFFNFPWHFCRYLGKASMSIQCAGWVTLSLHSLTWTC